MEERGAWSGAATSEGVCLRGSLLLPRTPRASVWPPPRLYGRRAAGRTGTLQRCQALVWLLQPAVNVRAVSALPDASPCSSARLTLLQVLG